MPYKPEDNIYEYNPENKIDDDKIIKPVSDYLFGEKSKIDELETKPEKKEKDYTTLGCLFIALVCAIPFIVSMVLYCCKLFKVLDCTWLQVFFPCIITYGTCTAGFILLCIVALIIDHFQPKKKVE